MTHLAISQNVPVLTDTSSDVDRALRLVLLAGSILMRHETNCLPASVVGDSSLERITQWLANQGIHIQDRVEQL